MGKMRNGLDTWLKQECANKGDNLLIASDLLGLATNPNNDVKFTEYLMDKAKQTIDLSGVSYDEGVPLFGFDKNSSTPDYLRKTSLELRTLAFEKVVECQCGKQTKEIPHGKFSSGDRVRVIGAKYMGIGTVTTIEHGKYAVHFDSGINEPYEANELEKV